MILPIDVVIPTYNRYDSVVRTISSIISCENRPERIIIVDQTQEDAFRKELRSYCEGIKQLVYVHSDTPSLTKARNVGMTYVKNEIVVCMDDDVDVDTEVFLEIYKYMNNTDIAMIAGWNTSWDDKTIYNSKIIQFIGYIFGKKNPRKNKVGHIAFGMFGRYPKCLVGEVETEWAMGFFFCIKKSLCKKWKIEWDENLRLYAYAEDLDFSYRYYKNAVKSNMRCILTDKVKVHHLVSEEWRTPSQQEMFMIVFHRAYLSRKLFGSRRSRWLTAWADYGMVLDMLRRKDNWKTYIKAIKACKKYRSTIENPNIMYSILEENKYINAVEKKS